MKSRRKFLTGVGAGAAALVLASPAEGHGRRSRATPVCAEPELESDLRGRGRWFPCILCLHGCDVYIRGRRYKPEENPIPIPVWHWVDHDEKEPMWACELPWNAHTIVKSALKMGRKLFTGHDFTVTAPGRNEMEASEEKMRAAGKSCPLTVRVTCCSNYGDISQDCCEPSRACCIVCGGEAVCVPKGSCVQCGNVCIPCNS